MEVPKTERLAEFCRRLLSAPPAASRDEALTQLTNILNAVEDELTTIPYDPSRWLNDGRLYPPQPDSIREVPASPGVRRFRSRTHNTFIGGNGAMEIVRMDGTVELRKPGADGRGVWELDPESEKDER
jgi:hypothetical protein